MSEIPLKNQIINWLKNQQYWFQYSGNEILEGNEISEKLVEQTYTYFKEDLGLIENTEKAPIDFKEITTTSSEISKKLFQKFECKGLTRFDYLLRNNEFYFIEANTLPGLSEASIFPQQLSHYGISLSKAFDILIQNTLV